MKLTIEVEDRYVSRFMRLLSNLRYVRLKARTMDVVEPAPEKAEHSAAEIARLKASFPPEWQEAIGMWADRSDMDDVKAFRRRAWGRDL